MNFNAPNGRSKSQRPAFAVAQKPAEVSDEDEECEQTTTTMFRRFRDLRLERMKRFKTRPNSPDPDQNQMLERIDHVILTGHPQQRLPGNASFCVEFIEGESMLMLLNSQGIAVSSGSSCTSRALKASHVLLAMGYNHEIAQGSILFTLGIENTSEDVDYVLDTMPPIVGRLRQMSPLYAKFVKTGKGVK
jgi:cysteine desulfurase